MYDRTDWGLAYDTQSSPSKRGERVGLYAYTSMNASHEKDRVLVPAFSDFSWLILNKVTY
jgi:hypothetical protein